jgi:hypothetical protein
VAILVAGEWRERRNTRTHLYPRSHIPRSEDSGDRPLREDFPVDLPFYLSWHPRLKNTLIVIARLGSWKCKSNRNCFLYSRWCGSRRDEFSLGKPQVRMTIETCSPSSPIVQLRQIYKFQVEYRRFFKILKPWEIRSLFRLPSHVPVMLLSLLVTNQDLSIIRFWPAKVVNFTRLRGSWHKVTGIQGTWPSACIIACASRARSAIRPYKLP